jgi:hypothetical protein
MRACLLVKKSNSWYEYNEFFKVQATSYSYSNAYELEYSLDHVIIMIYELAYSLYAMILTCSSLFFNINIIYMSRIRAKLRWWFILPSGVPKFFTCQSVGSGT